MSKRHKKHHEEHDEHPSEAWLIALADMMTLLMVTFLMMFAIAIVDLQKFKTFAKAFSEATGQNLPTLVDTPSPEVVEASKTEIATPPAPPSTPSQPLLDREDLEALQKRVQEAIEKAGIGKEVEVAMDSRGLVLYVTSGVLFASGEAQITGRGKELLLRLGPVLRPMSNELLVEGHTDARPISTLQFPSNWELSTSRAAAVVRQLEDADKIPRKRLSATGHADTKPRGTNATREGRARNRRVDIVIEAPEPPVPPAAAPAASAPPAETAPKPAAKKKKKASSGGH